MPGLRDDVRSRGECLETNHTVECLWDIDENLVTPKTPDVIDSSEPGNIMSKRCGVHRKGDVENLSKL